MRAYYDAVVSPALARARARTRKPRAKPKVQAVVHMQRILILLLVVLTLAISSGCVYRANISQGNLIKQEDLDQIEVGMTRNQVRFVLGTPLVDDPFHQQRWDYVYFARIGRQPATFKRWVTIVFENDVVAEIRADLELDPNL